MRLRGPAAGLAVRSCARAAGSSCLRSGPMSVLLLGHRPFFALCQEEHTSGVAQRAPPPHKKYEAGDICEAHAGCGEASR